VRSSRPPIRTGQDETRSRRYVSAVVFEASERETAVRVSEKLLNLNGVVWASSPAAADRADVYETLEIRLLGDGDLIVVMPEK
jgi:hypothetical protein